MRNRRKFDNDLGYFDRFRKFFRNSDNFHRNWRILDNICKKRCDFLEQNFKRYNAKMFDEIQLKFRFDTAENEPAKNLPILLILLTHRRRAAECRRRRAAPRSRRRSATRRPRSSTSRPRRRMKYQFLKLNYLGDCFEHFWKSCSRFGMITAILDT